MNFSRHGKTIQAASMPTRFGAKASSPIQRFATALAHGLTLVTHNTQDYVNVPGLTLVVYKGSGDQVVARATSDATGRFVVALRPGRYRIVPQRPVRLDSTPRMEPPVPDPLSVDITLGRVAEAVLICRWHSQTTCD